MELVNCKRVVAHAKRRCPHCGSGRWDRIGTIPDTIEAIEKALLVQYRCEKCGEDFVAEEAKGAVYVEDASACCHCGSRKVVQTSREGADMRLFVCLQCHGWMGVDEGTE